MSEKTWANNPIHKTIRDAGVNDGSSLAGDTCSLPSRAELSIRISDALDILDDLEKAKVLYGGFAKEQVRRIRATLKPPTENEREQP